MPVIDRVGRVAAQVCGLEKERNLVIGVSGGADSLCLLDVLRRLGYRLVVAHFDHQLRIESSADASRVAELARKMQLPFISEVGNVKDFATREGLSIEEAARVLRYSFLFKQAHACNAQAVAVGHTADDQVETVLMHLLRGSGLAGLRGMNYHSIMKLWDDSVPLVRPLLEIWREETHRYCQAHNLIPVEDISNQDNTYFRNRLRHQLIPILESYNPRWRQVMQRTSQLLAGDYEIIEMETEKQWAKLAQTGEGFVAINRKMLLANLTGLQRNLVRKAIAFLLPGLRDLDMETVERMLLFMKTSHPNRGLTLPGGLCVQVKGDRFFLFRREAKLPGEKWPQIPQDWVTTLIVPGKVLLPEGWSIHAEFVNPADITQDMIHSHHTAHLLDGEVQSKGSISCIDAWVDANAVHLPFIVRRHRSGERWSPLGMASGSIKFSDFFINNRLPQAARAGWPLVCSDDEVAWLPGFRPGNIFRVQEGTKRIIHLMMRNDE